MALHIDFAERIRKIRSQMKKRNLDGFVATKQGSLSYLLGVIAPWRSAVVIPMDGDLIGITVTIDADRVKKGTWLQDIRGWEWALKKPPFTEMITQALKEMKLGKSRVGLEYDDVTLKEIEGIRKDVPAMKLVDGSDLIDTVMLVKENVEIEFMKRAAQIADYGMEAAFSELKPGMTETELAGVAERAMRKAGNEWAWGYCCGSEVASGERTHYYHGWTEPPTRKIIQRGDMITVDLHPMYNLYLADQTNNAIIGQPTAKQRRLMDIWEEAVHILIDGLRPGAIAKDVASKVVKSLKKSRYSDHTIPLFGHGLGTSAKIPPIISVVSDDILQTNMMVVAVVNITEPGVGGVRIETPILITKEKPELFSKFPITPIIKD